MSDTPLTRGNGSPITLDELLSRQAKERGITPMALEHVTLLRRVHAGDWSGRYLAHAFISAYYIGQPFEESLGDLINLDAEGFRVFHQILHIRHVPGWRDDELNGLVREIKLALEDGGTK